MSDPRRPQPDDDPVQGTDPDLDPTTEDDRGPRRDHGAGDDPDPLTDGITAWKSTDDEGR